MITKPTILLPPLSVLYDALTRTRLLLYRRGLLKAARLPVPVISIGNITTGGTGKTPLVEWVVRALAREGKKVCVLTRGYGRANTKRRVLVSNGKQILASASDAGDEPRLLAENLEGMAAVISDADRSAAGRWAIAELGVDTFVLDDGFQHLQLERDLNLVTIDATNPWGGGKLLPHGRLREPVRGLARADCIVITRAELSKQIGPLEDQLDQISKNRPVVISRMKACALKPLDSGPVTDVAQPVAAFCAIGNPASFYSHLRAGGHEIVYTRAFADHHAYNQQDVQKIVAAARSHSAQTLITTAKDAVKLRSLTFGMPCYFLEIEITIDDEARLLELIRSSLRTKTLES